MISRKVFTHKSNYMILFVFFLSVIALFFDVLENNRHLENYNQIFGTFVSMSIIFWNVIFTGFILFFIPLTLLTFMSSFYKDKFFANPLIPKIYEILEKCPLILINTVNALIGSLLALCVMLLFSENPIVNSLSLFIFSCFIYLFSIMQLSMLIDLKSKINSKKKYF